MAIERADRYHYRVHWSDEDDAFIGTAAEPEFRYLSWIAETLWRRSMAFAKSSWWS